MHKWPPRACLLRPGPLSQPLGHEPVKRRSYRSVLLARPQGAPYADGTMRARRCAERSPATSNGTIRELDGSSESARRAGRDGGHADPRGGKKKRPEPRDAAARRWGPTGTFRPTSKKSSTYVAGWLFLVILCCCVKGKMFTLRIHIGPALGANHARCSQPSKSPESYVR